MQDVDRRRCRSTVSGALLGMIICMMSNTPFGSTITLTVGINDYFMVEEQLSKTLFCFGILFQVG